MFLSCDRIEYSVIQCDTIEEKRKLQSHPSRHDGVDVSGVAESQGHEVGVQRSDSLKRQPDVAGRGEVQQGRGGVVCTGASVDERGVNL